MPSIFASSKSDLSTYKQAEPQVATETVVRSLVQPVATMRCPLPPFNATIDTVRQFELGGQTPQIRVIPLPLQTGGNTTNIHNATIVSSGGSSGGGGSAPLTAASATVNSIVLNPGDIFNGTVTMAKSFQLLNLTASSQCDVRIYGSAAAQGFDSVRPVDTAVPAETLQNLIADVVLDSFPFVWIFQNSVGANSSIPQVQTMYVTVINTDPVSSLAITVTIGYLPLES